MKGDKRFWNKSSSSGSVFSFHVRDSSGEIRITAFKDKCEEFYDLVKVDQVYTIRYKCLQSSLIWSFIFC